MWVFLVLGLALVVAIGLVIIGRETARLAARPRPAVFDLEEAVGFIADRLSPAAQGRLSHDDVRWILLADADLLEGATVDLTEGRYPWSKISADVDPDETSTVDEDVAVARILGVAEGEERDLEDVDVAEVLDIRSDYLTAIGAIGDVADPGDVDSAPA